MNLPQLVILGSGLIGASLAKAAKQRGAVKSVTVVNRVLETSLKAIDLCVADEAKTYEDLPDVLTQLASGDIVVICVPVKSYSLVFKQLTNFVPAGVAVTDVGSTKISVIEAAQQQWAAVDSALMNAFVPGHPIAGSEQSGVEAANADLYVRRRVILTPLKSTDSQALTVVKMLWQAVGAEVDFMDAVHHDEVLAATSHLPHLLAYALVDSLVTLEETSSIEEQKSEIFRYAAGGFRDFTRIAQSDPVMWRDIFSENKTALINQLKNFEIHLAELKRVIETGNLDEMEKILERAQAARKHYSEMN